MNVRKMKKKIVGRLYGKIPTDQQVVEWRYKNIFGKKPNLKKPETFNEKITWMMLNYRNPLYELCSDKINVHEYIKAKGLEDILIPRYKIYQSVDEVNFDELPDSFVIKTTHSFGGVVVVKDKSQLKQQKALKTLKKSFNSNLYSIGREWQYKNLQPRIIAEEYIKPKHIDELQDYKIYCFNGKPQFIHVATDLSNGGTYAVDFYDTKWNHLDAQRVGRTRSAGITKPKNFAKMLKIASILSEDFPHVRVDLYNIEGRIYFGELTFTGAAGLGAFTDSKWDKKFGEYFELPKSGGF
jgi:hypothetical protein